MPRAMLVRRNDVDRIPWYFSHRRVGDCQEVGHKKKPRSSPEASRGLTARSSARLLLSGTTSGASGGTGISRLDGPAQSGCPNPARSIRDGQHISGFSTSRARKKMLRNTDLIQLAPNIFPDQGPLVPHSGAHNSNGEGGVSGKPKKTLIVPLLRSPGDRVRGPVGSPFPVGIHY